MTNKRFENRLNKDNVKFNTLNPVWDNEKQDALNVFEMIDMLNHLHEENQELRLMLNSCSDQRDEFYRGARENANCVGKLKKENEQLKKRVSKLQSKYDKNKTDELHILVETDNTVLLDKEEFKAYARRNNELKKRNKKRKEKNRNYRNELRKRLKEISGLKEFIAEDLSKEDKVLKGFIEEYL